MCKKEKKKVDQSKKNMENEYVVSFFFLSDIIKRNPWIRAVYSALGGTHKGNDAPQRRRLPPHPSARNQTIPLQKKKKKADLRMHLALAGWEGCIDINPSSPARQDGVVSKQTPPAAPAARHLCYSLGSINSGRRLIKARGCITHLIS